MASSDTSAMPNTIEACKAMIQRDHDLYMEEKAAYEAEIARLKSALNQLRQRQANPDKYLARIAQDNPGLYMRHVTEEMLINYT